MLNTYNRFNQLIVMSNSINKTFLVLLLIASSLCLKAQNNETNQFPSLDEVVKKFTDLQLKRTSDEKYFLEKRTDGWYVTLKIVKDDDYQVHESKLFWNKKNNEFNKINFVDADKEAEAAQDFQLDELERLCFKLEPYYGYDNWYNDVIALFENKNASLTAEQLNALGRAYHNKAINVMLNVDKNFNEKNITGKPESENSLSAEQLKTFKDAEQKAQEYYWKCYQKDASFNTFVGNIYIEYCNEVMYDYIALAYYQNLQEAKTQLKDNLYGAFYLNHARNTLSSCKPNAILLCWGDNDTYTMYYLQAKDNFRKDVLIVNMSLIQTSRYANFLTRKVFDAEPISFSLKPAFYAGHTNDYLSSEDSVITNLATTAGIDINTYKAPLRWVLKNDFMLLSLISANNWQRPIQSTYNPNYEDLKGLENNLKQQGISILLSPSKADVAFDGIFGGKVNLVSTLKWLKENYTNANTEHKFRDNLEKQMVDGYRTFFYRVAKILAEENKADAAALLKKSMTDYPDSDLPFDVYMIKYPELFYDCNEKEEADKLAEIFYQHAIANFDAVTKNKTEKLTSAEDRAAQEELYILQDLNNYYSEKHKELPFSKKLDDTFKADEAIYKKLTDK